MSHEFTLAPKPVKNCPPVVAPNVWQYSATHLETEGAAPVTANLVAAGDPAFYGGKLAVEGCDPVTFTITYLDGGDCNNCTVDTIATVTVDLTVDPKIVSSISIPDGYWQQIDYVVAAGAGVSAGQTTDVIGYSACVPDPCCVAVAI